VSKALTRSSSFGAASAITRKPSASASCTVSPPTAPAAPVTAIVTPLGQVQEVKRHSGGQAALAL
jgi:hypothetical protein